MTATEIQLASMIVHLVEFIDTGEPIDIGAAKGLMSSADVANILKPGPLLPLTRSGKSVEEILASK